MTRHHGRPSSGPGPGRAGRPWGQSLVEFSLILPIFLVLLFGVVDAGRFVYLASVTSQAAREAARVASVEASWMGSSDPSCGTVGGPTCPANVTALKRDITAAANRMVKPFGPITTVYFACTSPGSAPTGSWTTQSCGTNASTNLVSVRIVLTLAPVTPVIGQLVGSVTTTGSATMVIN
jgi:hypothetical protein